MPCNGQATGCPPRRNGSMGASPRPAPNLPFPLGWPAVACPLQGIGTDLHPLGILALIVRFVALRQVLLAAQPVAIGSGMIPRDTVHGAFRIGAVPVVVGMIDSTILLHELPVLPDRHFLDG